MGAVQLALAILAMSMPAAASPGTTGAAFLEIPVGARPAALGGAYTALATDAYAPIFNAAGLVSAAQPSLSATHLSYLQDVSYDFVGVALPRGRHSFGAALQRFHSGSIPETDLEGNVVGSFDSVYSAYTLSYGYRASDRLGLGVSAKALSARLADVGASALAFDLGAAYRASDRLRFGAAAANLGGGLAFGRESDPLPGTLRFGAAYALLPELTLSAELERQFAGQTDLRGGAEWTVGTVALRGGLGQALLSGAPTPAAGLGFKLRGHSLDYALASAGELGVSHHFSLTLRIGSAR